MSQQIKANWHRRRFVKRGILGGAALALQNPVLSFAQAPAVLEVACAGSVRAVLEGPLRDAAARSLHLDLRVHAGGADAVAQGVLDGSIPADVFVPVTRGPMLTVIEAGRATSAVPIASTEMVILYSPRSRFAPQFAAAGEGARPWWEVLEQPGLRFARSNPGEDPSGRCILFTMMLAEKKYNQPGLAGKILGSALNPAQVQPGTNIRKGLEDGSIDAAGSYKIATGPGQLPFVALAPEINLSDRQVGEKHPELSLELGGKSFHPEPLAFYAAALSTAKNMQGAAVFLKWLQTEEAATLLRARGFGGSEGAAVLREKS